MIIPKHKQVYMQEMGCGEDDILLCETLKGVNMQCTYRADEIHHIVFRSAGGKDELINLVAICRNCHDKAHGKQYGNKKMYRNIYLNLTKKRKKLLEEIPL